MLLSLVAIGFTGLLLGLLGGGGSVLILPLLVYLVGIDPVMSTSYSLVIVGSAALFGATKYLRQGMVDMYSVAAFGIPSVVGVFLTRSIVMPAIPEVLIAGDR
ncbi:MAG: TSUP family transporter, partial [Fuerstiella sp.]